MPTEVKDIAKDVVVPSLPSEWMPLIPKGHTPFVSQRFGALKTTALLCTCGCKVEILSNQKPSLVHWQDLISQCLIVEARIDPRDEIDWPKVEQFTDSQKEEAPIPIVARPEIEQTPVKRRGRPRKVGR